MPDLLHPQERDRLLAGLRRLLRQAVLEGQPLSGLAHCAAPGAPLHTLDNALAAEAMAIPALREADPALADSVLSFLVAVGKEEGPPPRAVLPQAGGRVEILRDDPASFRLLTPWHEFTGDLTHGVLRQRMRAPSGGNAPPREVPQDGTCAHIVQHTGNMARLRPVGGVPGLLGRLSLRARTLDVEEAITAQGVQPEGAGAVMWHESALRLRPLPGLSIHVGTLRYEYRVSSADPLLRVAVTLRAGSRAGLSAIRLTTAVDALSEAVPSFAHASVGREGVQLPRSAGPFAAEELLSESGAESLHLWQSGPEEEALALHLRPRAAEGVFSIRAYGRNGAPHWLVLRHSLADLPPGGVATLREDRLLAQGVAQGSPAEALRLIAAPSSLGGRDPGQAGIGAPLAAVAATLLNAPAFAEPIRRDRLAILQDWLDRRIAALPDDDTTPLPMGELASTALALDAAWRAGGLPRDRRRLRHLLTRLAAMAAGGGSAGLADQGAAVLALARGATLIPEPWVQEALRRAMLAITPEDLSDTVEAPPTRALAAVLRGARATEFFAETGRIAPDAEVLARSAALREAALHLLSGRLRAVEQGAGEPAMEVLSGSGEGADALSAATLLLAVLSPDEVALSMNLLHA